MSIRWIGALMIISACGTIGFAMAAAYRCEEQALRQVIRAMDYMACELHYHLTPLPELCRMAAEESSGCVAQLFQNLARELNRQVRPDVQSCLNSAMERVQDIPDKTRKAFQLLGAGLGKFDLEGQMKGLDAVRSFCRQELETLAVGRVQRLRSYQTLGLCSGAALAILFI